ncbi:hypothetical protein QBC44DRAFT_363654 [Cladorrhinum sp. PSN332]|nr:hypothetical protein QBC44DRAFT_363654 [Cladorrhinum sp. PSN332]
MGAKNSKTGKPFQSWKRKRQKAGGNPVERTQDYGQQTASFHSHSRQFPSPSGDESLCQVHLAAKPTSSTLEFVKVAEDETEALSAGEMAQQSVVSWTEALEEQVRSQPTHTTFEDETQPEAAYIPAGSKAVEISSPWSLWEQTFTNLKEDSEFQGLLQHHEKYMQEASNNDPNTSNNHYASIQSLAQAKIDKLSETRLHFHVGERRIVVREQLRKGVTVVLFCKDLISAAISSEPFTGLAWAGFTAVLPLIKNVFKQD